MSCVKITPVCSEIENMNEINNAPIKISSLGLINTEKDINIDTVLVLTDFAKFNRRINSILQLPVIYS